MIEIQFRLTAITMPITVSARHNRRIRRLAKHQILKAFTIIWKSFERQMTKINLLVFLKYTTPDDVYNYIYGNYRKEKKNAFKTRGVHISSMPSVPSPRRYAAWLVSI